MFRFFRNIRHPSHEATDGTPAAAENKTVRYLKYAVGEVLLIMVGIFLALQLNNWNKGRKLEQQRLVLIENLKTEFQANADQLDQRLLAWGEITSGLKDLMQISSGESNLQLSYDELRDLAYNLFRNSPYQPSLGYYHASVSTGTIELVENPSLINLIAQFEDTYRRFVSLDEIARQDYFTGSMLEVRKKYGAIEAFSRHANSAPWDAYDAPPPKKYSLQESDYKELLSQKDMYAIIANRYELKNRMKDRLISLKANCAEILTALEALD